MRFVVDRNAVMRRIPVCLRLRKTPSNPVRIASCWPRGFNLERTDYEFAVTLTTPFGSYPCGIIGMIITTLTASGCFRSSTWCRPDTRMCRVLCGHNFLVADSHGPFCASRLGATRL